MKKYISVLLVLVLSGCSGKLYTVVNPTITENKDQEVEGVFAYNSMNVIELYETTVLIDKASGNQLGKAPEQCTPERKVKFSTRTDYSKPYLIRYKPGLLETNKFGVTLDKGVLSGVNTESTPSAALSGIAEILPFFKAPKAESSLVVPGGKPLCNASPKLKGVYKAPDIQPFESME